MLETYHLVLAAYGCQQASTREDAKDCFRCKQASPWQSLDGHKLFGQGLSKGFVVQPKRQRGELRAGGIKRRFGRHPPSTRRSALSSVGR